MRLHKPAAATCPKALRRVGADIEGAGVDNHYRDGGVSVQ